MANFLNKSLALGIATLLVAGCSTRMFPSKEVREEMARNQNNLTKLRVGFSKDQVLDIMGPPFTTQRFPRYAKHLDYWLYFTRKKGYLDPGYTNSSYTFLAFENETLRGWGRDHEVIPIQHDHPLRHKLYSVSDTKQAVPVTR